MDSPEGERMPRHGIVLDGGPDEKIVVPDAFKAGWEPQEAFMVAIVTFEPEDGGTLYMARVRHWSEEALKRHQDMGFEPGWTQVAAQLAELAEAEETAAC